ncbi:uncharacterized protein J4E88_009764 [Alternaria novae-zelandiae]|uniref:uncharacterized protein n=1 Tax=Alternaria novae-zelandiae TaxID=430562 RepID=UPI0020C4F78E|nr:uncharacterized protein J4E88_009764 [Alternaria novae-zelandiae]KAI4670672.1 hypothetical protein J4E88_009764 [Alternaria novae-zelandiae]
MGRVAVSGVTETPEDELEESNVEDSSVDDELEAVLVVVSLVDPEFREELEDVAVLELEVDELEVVLVVVSLVDVESKVELEDEALLELELEELELEVGELAEDETYEYCEQQSPYFPPEQVIPAGDAPYRLPQRALVVTLTFAGVAEGAVDEAVRVEVEVLTRLDVVDVRAGATTPLQVPNDD